jgi:hypothetical protein
VKTSVGASTISAQRRESLLHGANHTPPPEKIRRTTSVPDGKAAEHVGGQSIPAGSLDIPPTAWTVNVCGPGCGEL